MDKKNYSIAIQVIVAVSLTIGLYFFISNVKKLSLPDSRVAADSGSRLVMGTFARVVAVAADSGTADKCIESAFQQLGTVDALMSVHKDDSQISEINRNAYKKPVEVSGATFEVLQKARRFSRLSNGAFDITVGPLVDLWQSAEEANSVPSVDELKQARSKVGYENLILDANDMSVRFAVDGMRLDAGGIAKGYAIDKAIENMQISGAIGAMVDVGGDIRCFGVPPAGRDKWLIGLQDPGKTNDEIVIPAQAGIHTGEPILVLRLKNTAIATSGDYRRFAVIEGERYGHIIDTKSGRSSEGLISVTIIAENAIDADALATAVTVLGHEKGLALIEKMPETEAILISSTPDYKLIKTTGAEKYIMR